MNKRPHNTDTERKCHRCEVVKEATPENFLRDKTRPLGLAYECKICHSARKKGRDRRPERWSNMTDEQKLKARARQVRYNMSPKGRAILLRKAYDGIDECDLTVAEVLALIVQPCTYCWTIDRNRGLDRLDNALPHVKSNVVPCCAACNFARGDRFTHEEMLVIGAAIRDVFRQRGIPDEGVQSDSRPASANLRPR